MGTVLAEGVVNSSFDELYDYDVVRALPEPTAILVRVDEPTIILGSQQTDDVLRDGVADDFCVRRRRGGGGAVFVDRHDLWVDWWIPRDDDRHDDDVRRSAVRAGEWWKTALDHVRPATWSVHVDGVEGDEDARVACFAGRGPGEVLLDGRKVVGLTQWRVREGIFVSTLMKYTSSEELLGALRHVPAGLPAALGHHTALTLELDDSIDEIEQDLLHLSGPWRKRPVVLLR